jgi:hypothetical protein
MSVVKRALSAAVVVTGAGAMVVSGSGLASATTAGGVSSAKVLYVVKDQGGGAFYNVKTGETFELAATSIAGTLAKFAVQAADGVVLTETGDILAPVGGASQGTPADQVVSVVATTGVGTYQDASTGAKFVISTASASIPAANELALKTATGEIVTINGKVLIPVESKTGLNK